MGEGCVGGLCASRADKYMQGACRWNLCSKSSDFNTVQVQVQVQVHCGGIFTPRFLHATHGLGRSKMQGEPSGLIGLFSPHLSLVPRYVLIRKGSSLKQPLCVHTAAPLVLNSILPYTRSLLPRFLFSLPAFPHCSLAATACFYLVTFYLFAISFRYCT